MYTYAYSSLFPAFLLQKMFKKKPSPHLLELETENKQLKSEIETLKRENGELREEINKLKQSLDEAVRSTRPRPAADSGTDSELQRRLSKTMKQLSDVQERLTILEQVTAATQRREMQQEGAYQNLPSDSVYEELRFDPTEEHVYAKLQLTKHTGCVIVFRMPSCCEIQSLFSLIFLAAIHRLILSTLVVFISYFLSLNMQYFDI